MPQEKSRDPRLRNKLDKVFGLPFADYYELRSQTERCNHWSHHVFRKQIIFPQRHASVKGFLVQDYAAKRF